MAWRHLDIAVAVVGTLTVQWAVPAAACGQYQHTELSAALEAKRVRLELLDGTRWRGQVLELQPGALGFRAIVYRTVHDAEFEHRRIPLDSLAAVWVDDGTYMGKGALTGAILTTILSVLLVPPFIEYASDGPCDTACYLEVGVGGAVMGGLLGGAIGALIVRWRRL